MPYQYTSIFEYKTNGNIVWELEEFMQDFYSEDKYVPKLSFGGKTECYKLKILEESILTIKNKINEIIWKI